MTTKNADKSEISKKFNSVSELFKQTTLENEKINPPKTLNYEQNLDIKYSNPTNTFNNKQQNKNYDPNNKKSEVNPRNSDATTANSSKYDDLQKPVFTKSKKSDDTTSNFVEIKQDGDVK